jgi:tetratricopeptide (TPR) repeat protein/O-antigen ligase
MDRITSRLASRYLSYGLPFLYLLTSIAFYLRTYDSAQVKITVVQMLATVLAGIWYIRLLSDGKSPFKKFLPVVLPLLASLVSGLLSYSHAAYPGPSLDETLRRVFYIHLALIALTEINSMDRLRRLIKYLLIATAISAGYGLIEMLDIRFFPMNQFSSGIDPFIWRQAFGVRIFSTFGNPNFFGNFLVIITPITLALMLKRNREHPFSVLFFAIVTIGVSAVIWKVDELAAVLGAPDLANVMFFILIGGLTLWAAIRFSFLGILFFLITLCNIVTMSKGAWVGYAASLTGVMMLSLFFFAQFQSEKLRRALKFGAISTLVVCALGVGLLSRQRMDSIRFRLFTWTSTWEMALPHPILGNGVGSFRVLYPAYRRPQIFHIEGKHNTETDHAENEYLEVFMDEGLVGFGIFIWVIVLFSSLGIKALGRFTEGLSIRDPATGKRKSSDDPRAYYMLGILAAFWGMLIHNFMDVSLRFVSSGIFLWLLAGLIGAMNVHDPLPEKDLELTSDSPSGAESSSESESRFRLPSIVLHFVCMAFFIALAGFVVVQFNDTQGPLPQSSGEQLLWLIAWVAVLGTIGASLWGLYRISESIRRPLLFLIFIAMLYPLYTFWGYFMADVHHNRGIFFSKQQKWDDALKNYNEVVKLNPNYIMAYYFMGNVYTDRWQEGDFEQAMKQYERAWAIAPNYVQSHHQAGLVYLKKGAKDKAAADAARAQGQMARVDALLTEVEKDWKKALFYFQKYHDIDPVFEPNYTRRGWVYIQLAELARSRGQQALANSYLDKAEEGYKESLGAYICGSAANDVIGEQWHRTHRHYSSDMFENLGNVRFIRGQHAEAAKAMRLAVAPPDPSAPYSRRRWNMEPSSVGQAINFWRDATNVRLLKSLGTCYGQLGDQVNLQRTWLKIRELAPTDPDVAKVFRH